MNRNSQQARDDVDARPRSAADEMRAPGDELRTPLDDMRAPLDDMRAPLDEPRAPLDEPRAPLDEPRAALDDTQATQREATAPYPLIDASASDDDDISPSDLDEAWARWHAVLTSADEDFDPRAAYARLAVALPADLVAIPLVERAAVRESRDARAERRNFAWGLVAMLVVCAGLAALAAYGPGWERRRDAIADGPSREERPARPAPVSPGAAEDWDDAGWDERLEALATEFDAERRRLSNSLAGPQRTAPYRLDDLERDFARVRDDFDRQRGF